jgi:hypothetical protein
VLQDFDLFLHEACLTTIRGLASSGIADGAVGGEMRGLVSYGFNREGVILKRFAWGGALGDNTRFVASHLRV